MRRLLIAAGLLGIAGCSNFRDLFSAHADVAATAGALELKTDRLGQILAGPKGAQLNIEAAQYVANLWTDYALFSQAVARGKLPSDSAAVYVNASPFQLLEHLHFADAGHAPAGEDVQDAWLARCEVRRLERRLGRHGGSKAEGRQRLTFELR